MTESDLPFADSLRAEVKWNQTLGDWQRMLAQAPQGCFIAEWNGVPAGTATTICYGKELAWIGMLLVRPDYRGRGIGRALLDRCLNYLRAVGISGIKLDATPQGKLLYDRLGFREEWPITRWETLRLDTPLAGARKEIRAFAAPDFDVITQLDGAAFGAMRPPVLKHLLDQGCQTWVHQAAGEIAGYGMIREGSRAKYLGPVAATSSGAGVALIGALLTAVVGEPVYWDIPDPNVEASALAKRLGFSPQRRLVRMSLGVNVRSGNPRQYFAIADPAVG
jgi:GNAT superfamily N-acetyltransferase